MPSTRRKRSQTLSHSPPLSLPELNTRISKALRLKKLGNTAYTSSDLEKAFIIFSACLELDSLQETYWLNRSLVAFDLHLYSRSIEDATRALECLKKAREAADAEVWEKLKEEAERLQAKAHLRIAEGCIRLGMLQRAQQEVKLAQWDDEEVKTVQNIIHAVSSASTEELQRWIRAQDPKLSIKEHADDSTGIFLRTDYEQKVQHYVQGNY